MITREIPIPAPLPAPIPSPLQARLALRPISPALRHWILGRDGFQCRAPGCDRDEGLEVHLIDPSSPMGRNNPANLITICGHCFLLWDMMGRGPFQENRCEEGALAGGL